MSVTITELAVFYIEMTGSVFCMRVIILLLVAISFLTSSSFAQNSEDFPLEVFGPYDYYTVGEQSNKREGQALCVADDNQSRLVASRMDFKTELNPALGMDVDTPSIKGCPSGFKPVIFIEGKHFQEGSIETSGKELPLNESVAFKLGKLNYHVDFKVLSPMWFAIDVNQGNQSQRIVHRYTHTVGSSGFQLVSGYINWAGDLDQDGKLDLLLGYSIADGGAGQARTLFLSSKAAQGELMKPVSKYTYWTCHNFDRRFQISSEWGVEDNH